VEGPVGEALGQVQADLVVPQVSDLPEGSEPGLGNGAHWRAQETLERATRERGSGDCATLEDTATL